MISKDFGVRSTSVVQIRWNAPLISNITTPSSKKTEYMYFWMGLMTA
ncbi:hypothetical protein MtrunA17_Chr1g0206631 [Medicago truncatula]|uniref:Uncharacterized protein n=1 Tax=Medicago truncatula TaxID=3880 RepID=A0A396JV00_MEDTR|nr:hypothetical protein MtrunA17_Chr1g0206631 [Medicago truncatula]